MPDVKFVSVDEVPADMMEKALLGSRIEFDQEYQASLHVSDADPLKKLKNAEWYQGSSVRGIVLTHSSSLKTFHVPARVSYEGEGAGDGERRSRRQA